MIQNIDTDFYELTGIRLKSVSQLQLFNILQDESNTQFFNIWRAYSINKRIKEEGSYFITYQVESDDWWDSIASKIYKNKNLWWIVALFNEVENPFEELIEGKTLYILKSEYLYTLLKEIKSISFIGTKQYE